MWDSDYCVVFVSTDNWCYPTWCWWDAATTLAVNRVKLWLCFNSRIAWHRKCLRSRDHAFINSCPEFDISYLVVGLCWPMWLLFQSQSNYLFWGLGLDLDLSLTTMSGDNLGTFIIAMTRRCSVVIIIISCHHHIISSHCHHSRHCQPYLAADTDCVLVKISWKQSLGDVLSPPETMFSVN